MADDQCCQQRRLAVGRRLRVLAAGGTSVLVASCGGTTQSVAALSRDPAVGASPSGAVVVHREQLGARTVEGHRLPPVITEDLRAERTSIAEVSAFYKQILNRMGWTSESIDPPADTDAALLWHKSNRAFELTFPSAQPAGGLAFQISESYVA